MLQRTRKKCWAIRNRIYPENLRPSTLLKQKIVRPGAENRVLLEIGCGRDAELLRQLAPSFTHAIGIDLENSAQPRADSSYQLIRANAHQIPLASDSIDVVLCVDVVEHLVDPATYFVECGRVLKPGGHLIISTVNQYFPPVVLGRMLPFRARQLLNLLVSGTEEQDTFPAYYRANTQRILKRLAADAALVPVSMQYVSCHPTYFVFSVWIYRIAVFFEQIIQRHERLGFLRHLIHAVFVNPLATGGERIVERDSWSRPSECLKVCVRTAVMHSSSGVSDGIVEDDPQR